MIQTKPYQITAPRKGRSSFFGISESALAAAEVYLYPLEPYAVRGVGSRIDGLEHPPASSLPLQHGGLAVAAELDQMQVVALAQKETVTLSVFNSALLGIEKED